MSPENNTTVSQKAEYTFTIQPNNSPLGTHPKEVQQCVPTKTHAHKLPSACSYQPRSGQLPVVVNRGHTQKTQAILPMEYDSATERNEPQANFKCILLSKKKKKVAARQKRVHTTSLHIYEILKTSPLKKRTGQWLPGHWC